MKHLTAYARKLASGNVEIDYGGETRALWPGHFSNCPDRRNKWIMLNCVRYRLIWGERPKA
jgi:hypothetical protein